MSCTNTLPKSINTGIQSRNASDSRTFVERWTAGTLVLVSDSFSIQTGKELSKDCALCWLGSPENGTILALCLEFRTTLNYAMGSFTLFKAGMSNHAQSSKRPLRLKVRPQAMLFSSIPCSLKCSCPFSSIDRSSRKRPGGMATSQDHAFKIFQASCNQTKNSLLHFFSDNQDLQLRRGKAVTSWWPV